MMVATMLVSCHNPVVCMQDQSHKVKARHMHQAEIDIVEERRALNFMHPALTLLLQLLVLANSPRGFSFVQSYHVNELHCKHLRCRFHHDAKA